MKVAKLLHNPGAGEGDYTKHDLISMIEAAGYDCSYSSTKKKGWEKIDAKKFDFLILAGGDGTIRKVAGELLDKKLLDKKLPIGLLPLGTANNIAKSLHLPSNPKSIIQSWPASSIRKFDVGRIHGLPKQKFMLEAFGYGVFPQLMEIMDNQPSGEIDTPQKSLTRALHVLLDLIERYDAKPCVIKMNDQEMVGKFLLVEVMNTRSIGPNLHLAPDANPSDGMLDVVLIHEDQRDEFAAFVKEKIEGRDPTSDFEVFKTKKIEFYWEGTDLHVDDEVVTLKEAYKVKIEIFEGLLEFLLPQNNIQH
jgi:diacylglycerol kinase (ATP)